MLLWAVVGLLVVIAVPYVAYVGLYYVIRPSGSPANKVFETEPVSVILPTYNEADIVASKLEELHGLAYPDDLEIVVVDSSDDDTAEIVRQFDTAHVDATITLIEESERSGVANAVNLAVEKARHDVLFRTDCDSKLDGESVTHAVANLQDAEIGGVTGRQSEVIGDSDVEQDYRDLQTRNLALESALDSTFIVHGPCFAFRREFFEPIASDSLADDTEIGVTIRRRGKRVVMDPEMQFAEVGVSDVRARRRRKDRRAMGLVQLLLRHRGLLGRDGAYGRIVLPFNWWFMIVSPWLLALWFALLFVTGIVLLGPLGLLVPAGTALFIALGHRDNLGGLQPLYAIFDSQLSLVLGSARLLMHETDGTWEIDTDSRKQFDDE